MSMKAEKAELLQGGVMLEDNICLFLFIEPAKIGFSVLKNCILYEKTSENYKSDLFCQLLKSLIFNRGCRKLA